MGSLIVGADTILPLTMMAIFRPTFTNVTSWTILDAGLLINISKLIGLECIALICFMEITCEKSIIGDSEK